MTLLTHAIDAEGDGALQSGRPLTVHTTAVLLAFGADPELADPAVHLARGEWLRWQINYRFTRWCGGERTYRLDTLNIVHGPARPHLFLGTPTRHVDELASLR